MTAPVIPWVNEWSGEAGYDVRPCRYAGNRPALWQRHAPGTGAPRFRTKHLVRERKAIAESRCATCGEPSTEGDRWVFPLGDWVGNGGLLILDDPPTHRACADLAMTLCPFAQRYFQGLGISAFRLTGQAKPIVQSASRDEVQAHYGLTVGCDRVVTFMTAGILETDVAEGRAFRDAYWRLFHNLREDRRPPVTTSIELEGVF